MIHHGQHSKAKLPFICLEAKHSRKFGRHAESCDSCGLKLSKLFSYFAMLVSLQKKQQQRLEAGRWVWTRPAGWLVGFTPGRCWRPRPSASASASAQTALDQERGRLTSSKQVNIGGGGNQSYQDQSVKMSFLRRGNSCVTPDMEIRKRLEVRLFNLHSESFSFVAVEMFQI